MRRCVAALAALALLGAAARADDGPWLADYAKAREQAAAQHKAVLLDFTGSDWCGWCMKLEKEVLATPTFLNYARKNLILVRIDHPKFKDQPEEEKRQSREMHAKYEVRSVPTLILLDADEKVLYRGGYQPDGPAVFVSALRKAAPPAAEGKEVDSFAAFAARGEDAPAPAPAVSPEPAAPPASPAITP